MNVTRPDGIVIRPLATHAERAEAVRIQEETWGAGFSEKVPAAMLLVAERTGGVAAAAFAGDDRMLGFVFGVTGIRDGVLVHWSDILAVRKDVQSRGIGRALKQYQHERCRAIGVVRMHWTYDPFVARNAHLNLNVLGARIAEFVPDMYGTGTNSPLHGNLGTDRFVVDWPVQETPTPMPDDPALLKDAVFVGGPGAASGASADALPPAAMVAVPVPREYGSLLAGNPDRARVWRASARRAFLHYLDLGYRVTAFVPAARDDVAAYLFSAP